MRFLVDECTGPAVADWLRREKHEIFSVYEQGRGMSDDVILQKAYSEQWILITNDKDFGEKVYRERRPHHGVILLRLADQRASKKIEALRQVIAVYADRVSNRFVVVTERQIRFR